MKSIKQEVQFEIDVNKSIFINFLVPVKNIEEIEDKLQVLRLLHPSANHHCYAYLLGNNHEVQKYSDDGEPNRTAGFPMMEVLKKNELTNILTVSIRYFGGIKLGAGGLVRAYSKSVAGAIDEATFTTPKTYLNITVSIPFDFIGVTEKYVRDNYKLIDTVYDSKVHYQIELLESKFEALRTTLTNHTKGVVEVIVNNTFEEYN